LVGSQLEISSQQIVNRLGDFNTSVDSLSNSLDMQARLHADTANKLSAQIATANNEGITATRAIVARLQELQARDNSSIGLIRSDLQELSRRVQSLSSAIERTGPFAVGPRSFRQFLAWLLG